MNADKKVSYGFLIKVLDALQRCRREGQSLRVYRSEEMILEIVKYGNPVLREKGREVKDDGREDQATRGRHARDDARRATASASPRSRSACRCSSR